jgi:hypothetical protein
MAGIWSTHDDFISNANICKQAWHSATISWKDDVLLGIGDGGCYNQIDLSI